MVFRREISEERPPRDTCSFRNVFDAGFLKADLEALRRMDINPSEQLVYLPKTENGDQELETVLAAELFE